MIVFNFVIVMGHAPLTDASQWQVTECMISRYVT